METKFYIQNDCRTPDKVHIFISRMPISSPNLMFDDLLESSHRDDSNKWSSTGFGEKTMQVVLIEVSFTLLSGALCLFRVGAVSAMGAVLSGPSGVYVLV